MMPRTPKPRLPSPRTSRPRTHSATRLAAPWLLTLLAGLTAGAQARSQGSGSGAPPGPVGVARAGDSAPPAGAAAGRPGGRRRPRVDLEGLLARFAHEPSVEAAQRAAVRLALADAGRPRRWLRRTARAAWLPTLQLGVGLQQRRDRGLDQEAGTANLLRAGATNQIAYEIKMSWDLPRLIFDPNALKVVREAQRIAELREQVVLQVTRLYFERRRVQLARWLRPVTAPAAALRRALRLAELTAVLNAMTGGLFRSRRSPVGPGAP